MRFFKQFNVFMMNENGNGNETNNQIEPKTKGEGEGDTKNGNETKTEQTPPKPINKQSIEAELKTELDNWTSKYGSVFKFINAQPKVVTSDVKAAIMDDSKNIVDEAIKSIVAILANDKFKDKIEQINVVGHTSSTWGRETGKPAAVTKNQALSKLRADSVVATINAIGGEAIKGVKIVPEGKGLTELIISNDVVEGAPTGGKGAAEVTNFNSLKEYTKPEAKQVINRRVVIKLPTIAASYEVQAPEETVEAKKSVSEPVAPSASSIQFNFDSYIPTKASLGILTSFAQQLTEYNKQSESKKTDVYICAHSHKGKSDKKDEKRQEENIFFISLNRAVMVRNVLQKAAPDVRFHMIPVSFHQMQSESSKDNKRVELHFEQNEQVTSAKKIFGKLAGRYNVEQQNGEYSGDAIMKNRILRSNVIKNANTAIDNNHVHKFIPLELWHTEFGGKHEQELQKFRDKLIRIVGSEDEVAKYVYDRL
jgi:outer membrane protein OmpA-like peptidoglycan-associated protein